MGIGSVRGGIREDRADYGDDWMGGLGLRSYEMKMITDYCGIGYD